MKIIDITRPLTPSIAVWPGDQPFETRWSAQIETGSSVNVGALTMSTHTGTHADAPLHYEAGGAPIDAVPLSHFVGDAWVVEVEDDALIRPTHLEGIDLARYPRVLFKTRSSRVPETRWHEDFLAFDPATIDLLGRHGVLLIGTDAPSVDPADSTALPAHHALARHGIVNLENLLLMEAPAGPTYLVALPIKVAGLDAAPVRAILTTR